LYEFIRYRTVASSFIAADHDACNDALAEPIFGKRHSCDRVTTFCLPTTDPDDEMETQSTRHSSSAQAQYTCVCKEGFFTPNQTLQGFTSDKVEHEEGNFSCLPCPNGCKFCDKDGVCDFNIFDVDDDYATEKLLRAIIGSVLAICFACCILLAFIVYHRRKQKVIFLSFFNLRFHAGRFIMKVHYTH
jgi:hypothetical protein